MFSLSAQGVTQWGWKKVFLKLSLNTNCAGIEISLNLLHVHLAVGLLLHQGMTAVGPNNSKCDTAESLSLQNHTAYQSLFQACVTVGCHCFTIDSDVLTALKTPGLGPVKQGKVSHLLQQGLDPISEAGCVPSLCHPVLCHTQSPVCFPTPLQQCCAQSSNTDTSGV